MRAWFALCDREASRGSRSKVSSFDPRQRPIQILGHTAMLSRRMPIDPDAATIGMRLLEGVPAGTLHAIAARVPAETLTAATPVTGPDGNSWTARSAADPDGHAAGAAA